MTGDKQAKNGAGRVARDAVKPEQKNTRNTRRGGGEVADWSSVDAGLLREALSNVTRHGYALMFGYTQNGSAYTCRVVGDANAEPDYIRPTEDINVYLQALAFDYE